MDRASASRLIKDTFENPFDKAKFAGFTRELLNRYEPKEFTQSGQYIISQFKGHISSYDRIGQYTDSDGNLIDILIIRTNKESSLARARTLQRNFIAWYLNGGRGGVIREAALAAVVSPSEETWRFSLVRMDYRPEVKAAGEFKVTTEFTPAKRYSFLVGKGENTHTAQERLRDILQAEGDSPTLNRLQDAFSVEKVTSDFYNEYKEVFTAVEDLIKGVDSEKRLFTQRLFNRLLFIRFLEKKKWLRYQGSYDYLESLFTAAKKEGQDFYRDRLCVLFFEGLGRHSENPPDPKEEQRLIGIRGEVPFLNGGLFEKESGDESPSVHIPNKAFDLIFDRLFRIYNFTVEEGTPVDVDVAVDPEMLGRIFEELVTGRHDSGSYYTPRPIVSFMCREALKGYLHRSFDESEKSIEKFVDEHDPSGIRNPEQALDALRKVRACDPACGSGAYLLGMLHELIDLRSSLMFRHKISDENLYERKLEIISKNLYGVDLDPFAVNVARLRLWLSLIVEDGRDALGDPKPDVSLPNLDLKVEIGDSVLTPQPSTWKAGDLFREAAIQQFAAVKVRYMRSYGERKAQLQEDLNKARAEISAAAGRKWAGGFDWQVEFAEIFLPVEPEVTIGGAMNFGQELAEQPEPGGFDIVLANPPYVRHGRIKGEKPALEAAYGDLFCGSADLYVYFYLRAVQLLKPGGMIAFISSNKWFRAKYGENLRKYIAEQCTVRSITDFGELPVFNAATFPMIFVAQKGASDCQPLFTQVKSLDAPYPNVLAIVQAEGQVLPADAIKGANWMMADAACADRIRKMEKAGMPLREYVKGRLYRGVTTGFNAAFVIDSATRQQLIAKDARSAELIKPLIVGDDVQRWHIIGRDRWLVFARRGIDIDAFPAIKNHLMQWREELTPRPVGKTGKGRKPGRYAWYEIQDETAYYREFAEAKILIPAFAMSPKFCMDYSGSFVNGPCYFAVSDDLYLLGIMNSETAFAYLRYACTVLGDQDQRGRVVLRPVYFEKLPIPNASNADKQAISALVQKCLDAKGVDCEAWEREIDERVSALYGL